MSASENKVVKEGCADSNQGVFIYIFIRAFITSRVMEYAYFCLQVSVMSSSSNVKIVTGEEEVEHAERMANWAAI